MKIIGQFGVFFIILLISSCSKEEYTLNVLDENSQEKTVYQERRKDAPDVKTKKILNQKTRFIGENGEQLCNSDALLGYSYNIGNSIMGDVRNIGMQILDIEKIRKINNGHNITAIGINHTNTDILTYSDFQRYIEKSSVVKKISSGFRVKIGPFSIGRKKRTTEVFTKFIDDSTNVVYGELGIKYAKSSFNLNTIESQRKRYASECLSETFLDDLYGNTINGIMKAYGEFLLSGYVTGGKLTCLYRGIEDRHTSIEKKEKNMNTVINASFSWKKKKGGNIDIDRLIFGKNNYNYDGNFSLTKNTEVHLELAGGKQGTNVGTSDLDKLDINLTQWCASLDDTKTHTIVDVLDGGLYPLSDFFLEKNFKIRYESTINGTMQKKNKLENPCIEIGRYYVRKSSTGIPLYNIAAILYTRQKDKIVLCINNPSSMKDEELAENEKPNVFKQKCHDIADKFKKFFGLYIQDNSSLRLNPTIYNDAQGCIVLNFRFENMYRWTNPKSNIEYLYYQNPKEVNNKYAFSLYVGGWDGDVVLDNYVMRDWTSTFPEKSISMSMLANSYTIIGL